jgi:hypothetical protein
MRRIGQAMPDTQRLRWLELLSYIHALVYHDRAPSEHQGLQQTIESSVKTDTHRQEVIEMRRTIADELRAEGFDRGRQESAIATRQQTLLRLLRRRFGEVPAAVEAVINATKDIPRLDAWLDQVVTALTLEAVGIRPEEAP